MTFMFILLVEMKKYRGWVSSGGIMFVQNLMKILELFEVRHVDKP